MSVNILSLITDRRVKIKVLGTGYYGRTIGTVYRKREDVNKKMVSIGWAYNEGGPYDAEEEAAKASKLGVHEKEDAIKPKAFRNAQRGHQRIPLSSCSVHRMYCSFF